MPKTTKKFFDGKDFSVYLEEFRPLLKEAYETLKRVEMEDLMETVGLIALSCDSINELKRKLSRFFYNLTLLKAQLLLKELREFTNREGLIGDS